MHSSQTESLVYLHIFRKVISALNARDKPALEIQAPKSKDDEG